jgi:hypothetical protein
MITAFILKELVMTGVGMLKLSANPSRGLAWWRQHDVFCESIIRCGRYYAADGFDITAYQVTSSPFCLIWLNSLPIHTCYLINIYIMGELTMSDIKLTDITIHIDKNTDADTRAKVESGLRIIHGVVSVHMPADKPHLVVVEYNPDETSSKHILTMVEELVGHAEMIGL